jgi:integrating conjugative element protein (TIGR03752 family)
MCPGYAIGDLRLRSVQGWITSVTFIFPDGHIQTIRSDHSGGHFSTENTLGYLSDPYGNPFLPGQLITNAPQAIGTQALLGSVKGLSQLKTGTQSPLFTRLFGSAAHQASGGVMQWWQAHAAQGFDAIYVPAGQSVAVNFTQAIAIDYHPDGRRVTYERHRLLTDAFYHNPWE